MGDGPLGGFLVLQRPPAHHHQNLLQLPRLGRRNLWAGRAGVRGTGPRLSPRPGPGRRQASRACSEAGGDLGDWGAAVGGSLSVPLGLCTRAGCGECQCVRVCAHARVPVGARAHVLTAAKLRIRRGDCGALGARPKGEPPSSSSRPHLWDRAQGATPRPPQSLAPCPGGPAPLGQHAARGPGWPCASGGAERSTWEARSQPASELPRPGDPPASPRQRLQGDRLSWQVPSQLHHEAGPLSPVA